MPFFFPALLRRSAFLAAFALAIFFSTPVIYGFVILAGLQAPLPTLAGIGIALFAMGISWLIALRVFRVVTIERGLILLAFFCGTAGIYFHSWLSGWLPVSLVPFRDTAVFDGGVMEEIAKGVFLLLFAFASRRCFPDFMTGLAVGWIVGMGFEFLENMSYFRSIVMANEPFGIAFRLVFGALGGHPLYTGLTGGLMGLFLPYFGRASLWWIWPLALLPGIALHMASNWEVLLFFMPIVSLVIIILLLTIGLKRHGRNKANVT